MHLLCQRDRAGAKAIAKAWKLEGNPKSQWDVRWQSSRRDPMSHANFFREIILTYSDKELDKLNRDAVNEQARRTTSVEEFLHTRVIP